MCCACHFSNQAWLHPENAKFPLRPNSGWATSLLRKSGLNLMLAAGGTDPPNPPGVVVATTLDSVVCL